jgi:hypothetical protein
MIYKVELQKLRDTIENIKKNPGEAKRVTKIEGTWNIDGCPVVFCLTNPIRLETELVVQE